MPSYCIDGGLRPIRWNSIPRLLFPSGSQSLYFLTSSRFGKCFFSVSVIVRVFFPEPMIFSARVFRFLHIRVNICLHVSCDRPTRRPYEASQGHVHNKASPCHIILTPSPQVVLPIRRQEHEKLEPFLVVAWVVLCYRFITSCRFTKRFASTALSKHDITDVEKPIQDNKERREGSSRCAPFQTDS